MSLPTALRHVTAVCDRVAPHRPGVAVLGSSAGVHQEPEVLADGHDVGRERRVPAPLVDLGRAVGADDERRSPVAQGRLGVAVGVEPTARAGELEPPVEGGDERAMALGGDRRLVRPGPPGLGGPSEGDDIEQCGVHAGDPDRRSTRGGPQGGGPHCRAALRGASGGCPVPFTGECADAKGCQVGWGPDGAGGRRRASFGRNGGLWAWRGRGCARAAEEARRYRHRRGASPVVACADPRRQSV